VLYDGSDFGGRKQTYGPGEHNLSAADAARAVRLVPRPSGLPSWATALNESVGGNASWYTHDKCEVRCCEPTVEAYQRGLHEARELAVFQRDAEAANHTQAMCEEAYGVALAPLSACAAFRSVRSATCALVANADAGIGLFGALPMFTSTYYAAPLTASLAEMTEADGRLALLGTGSASVDQLRSDLLREEATLQAQIARADADFVQARGQLRGLGGTVQALGASLRSSRLTEHIQPLLGGRRAELERHRFEVAAAAVGWAPLVPSSGGGTRRALSTPHRRQLVFFALAALGTLVVTLVTVSIVTAVVVYFGGVACELIDCDGEETSLHTALGTDKMTQAWEALAVDELYGGTGVHVLRELAADHGEHRLSRAVAMASAAGRLRASNADRSEVAIRGYLLSHVPPAMADLASATLHIADNSGSSCPSIIAAYSPGDAYEPGPSLYFGFESTSFHPSGACTVALSLHFLSKGATTIDGIGLNPGYADYVLGTFSRNDLNDIYDGTARVVNALTLGTAIGAIKVVRAAILAARLLPLSYTSPWEFILRVLDQYRGVTFTHITLAGHSLGGALATVAGVKLREHLHANPSIAHRFHVNSFGSPRVVADSSVGRMGPKDFPHTRVTYGNDPVAELPKTYFHSQDSVHFGPNSASGAPESVPYLRAHSTPRDCWAGSGIGDVCEVLYAAKVAIESLFESGGQYGDHFEYNDAVWGIADGVAFGDRYDTAFDTRWGGLAAPPIAPPPPSPPGPPPPSLPTPPLPPPPSLPPSPPPSPPSLPPSSPPSSPPSPPPSPPPVPPPGLPPSPPPSRPPFQPPPSPYPPPPPSPPNADMLELASLLAQFRSIRAQTASTAQLERLIALTLANETLLDDDTNAPAVLPQLYLYGSNLTALQTRLQAFGTLLVEASSTALAAEAQSFVATACRRLEFVRRWYEQFDLVRRARAQRTLLTLDLERIGHQRQALINRSALALATRETLLRERSAAAATAMTYLHAQQRAYEYWSLQTWTPPVEAGCRPSDTDLTRWREATPAHCCSRSAARALSSCRTARRIRSASNSSRATAACWCTLSCPPKRAQPPTHTTTCASRAFAHGCSAARGRRRLAGRTAPPCACPWRNSVTALSLMHQAPSNSLCSLRRHPLFSSTSSMRSRASVPLGARPRGTRSRRTSLAVCR
jgi:hypothetical protein